MKYNITGGKMQEEKEEESRKSPWQRDAWLERMGTLTDWAFDWKENKKKVMELARLYQKAWEREPDWDFRDKLAKYAKRASECAAWLEYGFYDDGTRGDLQRASFCHLRLCPLCTERLIRWKGGKLSEVMEIAKARNPGLRFIFLTLTWRNVPGEELSDSISNANKAFNRLMGYKKIEESWVGWFKAMEITYNAKRHEFHPHFHVLAAVKPEYFFYSRSLYISHEELVEYWRRAMRLDYNPSVHVETTYGRGGGTGRGTNRAGKGPTKEAAKRTVKDRDILNFKGSSIEYIGYNMADHSMADHSIAGHSIAGHSIAGHGMTDHSVAGHGMAGHSVAGHNMAGHGGSGKYLTKGDDVLGLRGMAGHGVAGHGVAGHGAAGRGHAAPANRRARIVPMMEESEAADVLRFYTRALLHRRCSSFGGILKPIAKEVDADRREEEVDLAYEEEEEEEEEENYSFFGTYRWTMGVGDYVLYKLVSKEGKSLYLPTSGQEVME